VFTTVFVLGPAPLMFVFGAAIADGSSVKVKAIVKEIRALLVFMVHRDFYLGILV
jgi:hypothetical protein